MGYRQGKDHSFWAESIEVIKGNEILNDFINEIEEIPKKLQWEYARINYPKTNKNYAEHINLHLFLERSS